MNNLLKSIPTDLPEELTETLLKSEHVRIERIISRGHASPEGFWYDQPQQEWVVLLTGSARLRFADTVEPIELQAGDFLLIEAGRKHRVESTSAEEHSIWLAIHFD
jgi:cupin 2 domain-containing protein